MDQTEFEKEKVYIFLSHSHKDIEKVRKIRNFLEDLGGEPILFFLKSKNDEDEITQLIKDEIDIRFWFIYCKSELSEASKWCQMEVDYVKQIGKRQIEIDIDNCLDEDGELKIEVKTKLLAIYKGFSQFQHVYIDYIHSDAQLVHSIIRFLNEFGIKTYTLEDERIGSDWMQSINKGIATSDFGLFFFKRSSVSDFLQEEIAKAKKFKKEIVPVLMFSEKEDNNDIYEPMNNGFLKNYPIFEFNYTNAKTFRASLFKLFYSLIELYLNLKGTKH